MSLWCSEKEKVLSSFLVMFRLGLWLKMRFIAMSMVSWSRILVKRLVTSQETRSLGTKGERRSQKKWQDYN